MQCPVLIVFVKWSFGGPHNTIHFFSKDNFKQSSTLKLLQTLCQSHSNTHLLFVITLPQIYIWANGCTQKSHTSGALIGGKNQQRYADGWKNHGSLTHKYGHLPLAPAFYCKCSQHYLCRLKQAQNAIYWSKQMTWKISRVSLNFWNITDLSLIVVWWKCHGIFSQVYVCH